MAYHNGEGEPKSDAEGIKWLKIAVGNGDRNAQYYLGTSYESGKGIAKDEAEALRWYRKSAEQPFVLALHKVAEFYAKGRGGRT